MCFQGLSVISRALLTALGLSALVSWSARLPRAPASLARERFAPPLASLPREHFAASLAPSLRSPANSAWQLPRAAGVSVKGASVCLDLFHAWGFVLKLPSGSSSEQGGDDEEGERSSRPTTWARR